MSHVLYTIHGSKSYDEDALSVMNIVFNLQKKALYFLLAPKCMELHMHIYVLNIILKKWNDYNHILILFEKSMFGCSYVISWVLEREEIMQCIYVFINHILNLKANRN